MYYKMSKPTFFSIIFEKNNSNSSHDVINTFLTSIKDQIGDLLIQISISLYFTEIDNLYITYSMKDHKSFNDVINECFSSQAIKLASVIYINIKVKQSDV